MQVCLCRPVPVRGKHAPPPPVATPIQAATLAPMAGATSRVNPGHSWAEGVLTEHRTAEPARAESSSAVHAANLNGKQSAAGAMSASAAPEHRDRSANLGSFGQTATPCTPFSPGPNDDVQRASPNACSSAAIPAKNSTAAVSYTHLTLPTTPYV